MTKPDPKRTSPDSAWPLKNSKGETWAQAKERDQKEKVNDRDQ